MRVCMWVLWYCLGVSFCEVLHVNNVTLPGSEFLRNSACESSETGQGVSFCEISHVSVLTLPRSEFLRNCESVCSDTAREWVFWSFTCDCLGSAREWVFVYRYFTCLVRVTLRYFIGYCKGHYFPDSILSTFIIF